MSDPKTIMFRGHACIVLDERGGRMLVDGPRGQEWAKRREMTRLRVYTETHGKEIGQAVGSHVEYEGVVLVVSTVELMGDSLTYATLDEVADADEIESPQAFERFMAANRLRMATIEKWGYCYVPVDE
jgi:hypothetical protein